MSADINKANKNAITSSAPWHTLTAQQALDKLKTNRSQGLSEDEAAQRLKHYGKNELAHAPPRPAWKKFLDQFKSFLVIVLLIAAALAWAIGDIKDAIVILIVTLFNSTLGFYQEHRAEQTLQALKNMLSKQAKVRRDKATQEIEAALVVPGDIVLLEAGDQVPADGRILEAHNLEVAEAALTGESVAVGKSLNPIEQEEAPLAERENLLFMNTVVTKGRAEIVVTGTGDNTEMGKIAGMISQTPESKTPLQKQLDTLGKRLALIAAVVVACIFIIDYIRGVEILDAAMKAVALAVAAVPEGLPAVVTVTLAIGMWRMANNKAILKKLSAVETLGSTTVICSDKTGTLTMNKMSAKCGLFAGQEFCVDPDGENTEEQIPFKNTEHNSDFIEPLVLCSEATIRHDKMIGDPTETALLELAVKSGFDVEKLREKFPRIAEIPFDSSHKFMATFHHKSDSVVMYIKGAPDVLLKNSNFIFSTHGQDSLEDQKRADLEEHNIYFAEKGLRVLGVAKRVIAYEDFDPSEDLWQWAENWTFLGMVGIMDPPRPEATEAIALCKKAGIQVKMITGDHKATAATIARELGLEGEVVLGKEIDEMDLDELGKKSDSIAVFARVSPENKVKIVKALKARGHVTAMTGDGVNDAPALKTADIGVAMGITGTAVTKEAATLVLTDDNFATIVRAVREGRVIYSNIVKFVRFQLSTNIGAILTVLGATLTGLPAPFTPIQLLWINIIMDGPPAMSLGVEKVREGLMEDPPRPPGAQILSIKRLMLLIFYGIIMMSGTLFMFYNKLQDQGTAYAVTMAFTTFVFFQFFNVFNAREEKRSVFNSNLFTNAKLWSSLLIVLLLQFVVVYWPPAQSIFKTVALEARDWIWIVGTAVSVLVIEELRKLLWNVLK